jgi:hypothetical protein
MLVGENRIVRKECVIVHNLVPIDNVICLDTKR